ncbi:site-specific integrase [Pelagibacterium flavum]|uniref:Site-specific integrase n=1 Tax=Pelagibacterium flavum TaxID=2984530 RepID=A0ABY6IKZ5_9HYPH|nr:site-specific integrase [Pelagibacterium sp. YIM 151497]UYQ71260.1 site-specific integrase [Pelagibacterium sp. YIM 151497]
MGTIVERKRRNGSTGYTAQILIKRGGKIVYRQAQTFDRKQAANAWIKKRETELAEPGAIERENAPKGTLADAIDKYTETSAKAIGKTKEQVLRSIKGYPIAELGCDAIRSDDIVAFGRELHQKMQPQTVGNYMSHLAAIFAIARPAWGYPLDPQAMKDASAVMRRLGYTSKSKKRERRPTLAELDKLMTAFKAKRAFRPNSNPMTHIVAFALFSTRRQEEITRIKWADLDETKSRILVRDMKHPGDKMGNDTWVNLPPEAMAIIKAMPRVQERIFPHGTDAISAAFTRTCQDLEIDDLRFHDLRHEGASRLFEMGWQIPNVAAVTGHRTWASLQRYTHLDQAGDKYENWPWFEFVTSA